MTTCANCDGAGCWGCKPAMPQVTNIITAMQHEDMVRELTKVHAMLDGAGVPPMADAPGRLAARIAYLLTVWQGAETRAGANLEMYHHARLEWQVLELAANAAMEETE